jgi:hypothetical protein
MSGAIDNDFGRDFEEHLKTYRGFLRFLQIGAVVTFVALALLYFFLAR